MAFYSAREHMIGIRVTAIEIGKRQEAEGRSIEVEH